jgi:hypothetical protein
LIGKEVVVIVLLVLKLRGTYAGVSVVLYLVLIAEIPVSKGEHIIADLEDCEGEVNVCQLEVETPELGVLVEVLLSLSFSFRDDWFCFRRFFSGLWVSLSEVLFFCLH